MSAITRKACRFADKQVRKGGDTKEVAFAMLRAGIEMIRDGTDNHLAEAIVRIEETGNPSITVPEKGFSAAIIEDNAPNTPENRPRTPQEADSGLPAPVEARTLRGASDAPLDRQEMLDWLDMKIIGCQKHGMSEAFSVLKAMRGEIAQHIESAPIDYATLLRAFYIDCHERNVKAGWWSDLASNEPKKRSVGELFMLFVTELWEAYSAYVEGAMDDKLPDHPGIGVELGDLQIRLADFAGALAAGRIVECSGVGNPGDMMFCEVGEIASRYERMRKTPEAAGEIELGEPIAPMDVAAMTIEKLAYNATREDHKIENRKKEGGKQT